MITLPRRWRTLGTALWTAAIAACGVNEQPAATEADAAAPAADSVAAVSQATTAVVKPAKPLSRVALIKLNGGAAWTSSRTVNVALTRPTGTAPAGGWAYCLNESPTDYCTGMKPVPASGTIPFTVTTVDAATSEAAVFVTFNDEALTTSKATIKVDETKPVDGDGTLTAAFKNGLVNVPLSWTAATDAGSGVVSYRVMFDAKAIPANCSGTPLAVVNVPALKYDHRAPALGTAANYRVCAVDAAGNVSTGQTLAWVAKSEGAAPDSTAVSLTVKGVNVDGFIAATALKVTVKGAVTDASATASAPVQLLLTAANKDDTVAAPAATAAGWARYAAGTDVSVTLPSGDGEKTLRAFFRDVNGNVTALADAKTATVKLDQTAPTGGSFTVSRDDGATANTTKVTLTVTSATDAGVGGATFFAIRDATAATLGEKCAALKTTAIAVTGTEFSVGSSIPATATTPATVKTVAIRGCFRDALGNTTPGTVWSGVALKAAEDAAPVVTDVQLALFSDAAGANAASAIAANVVYAKLSGAATDANAAKGLQVCLAEGNTPCAPTSASWIRAVSTPTLTKIVLSAGDGAKSVSAWYRDLYGNVSEAKSANVQVDMTAPLQVAGDVGLSRGAPGADGKVEFSLSSLKSDDAGGVGGTTYLFAQNANAAALPAKCTGGAVVTAGHKFSAAGGTTLSFRVCARDALGNTSAGLLWTGVARPEDDAPVTTGVSFTLAPTSSSDGSFTAAFKGVPSDASEASGLQVCLSTAATVCAAASTDWKAFASDYTATVVLSAADKKADGAKTVNAWFRDAWRNTAAAPVKATALFDTKPPVGGALRLSAVPGGFDATLTGVTDASAISFVVSAKTGTVDPVAKCTGDVLTSCTTTGPTTRCTGLTAGSTYRVRVCPKDAAAPTANVAAGVAGTVKVISTITAPTLSAVSAPAWIKARSVELTLSAAGDSNAKIASWCAQLGDAVTAATCRWTAFAAPATPLTNAKVTFALDTKAVDGLKPLSVWVKDEYDNVSQVRTTSTTLDMASPVKGNITVARDTGAKANITVAGFTDLDPVLDYVIVRAEGRTAAVSCGTESQKVTGCTRDGNTFSCDGFDAYKTWNVGVCAVDDAGNAPSAIATATLLALPPDTTGVTVNVPATTTVAAIKATLSGYPATATRVCASTLATAVATCFNPKPTGNDVNLTLPAEGKDIAVRVWFQDANGTNSAPVEATGKVTFDGTAPVDGAVDVQKTSQTAALVTPSLFTDALSGPVTYLLEQGTTASTAKCAKGNPRTLNADGDIELSDLTAGTTYFVRVCARDALGNTSAGVELTLKMTSNLTPPTISSFTLGATNILDKGAKKYATATGIKVSFTAAAAANSKIGAWCLSEQLSCPADKWTKFTTAATQVATLTRANTDSTLSTTEGAKTLRLFVRDIDENVETAQLAVTLDTKAPTDGTVTAARGDASMALTVSGFSDTSGIASYRVAYVERAGTVTAPPANCNGTFVTANAVDGILTVSGLTNLKSYLVRVCAVDAADRVSTGVALSGVVKPTNITTPPSVTLDLKSGGGYANKSPVALALTASPAAGATVASYCVTDAATCPTTGWVAVTDAAASTVWSKDIDVLKVTGTAKVGDGTKTFNAWVRDDQDNQSLIASKQFVFDSTAPTNLTATAAPKDGRKVQVTASAKEDVSATTSGLAGFVVTAKAGDTNADTTCSGTDGATKLDCDAAMLCSWPTPPDSGTAVALRVCARDNAGNVSAGVLVPVTVVSSTVPPEVTATFVAGGTPIQYAGAGAGTIAITATAKGGALIRSYCLSTTATCTSFGGIPGAGESISGYEVPYVLGAAGATVVRVFVRDTMNNVGVGLATVNVDTKAPTDGGNLWATAGSMALQLDWWAASDDVALGGYRAFYRSGPKAPEACAASATVTEATGCRVSGGATTCTINGLAAGAEYGVRLCAYDLAGNASAGVTAVGTTIARPNPCAQNNGGCVNRGCRPDATGDKAECDACDAGAGWLPDAIDGATKCVQGCGIGGQAFVNGAVRAGNVCEVCDVASPSVWSSAPSSKSCTPSKGTIGFCQNRACVKPNPCAVNNGGCINRACQADAATGDVAECQACGVGYVPKPGNAAKECVPGCTIGGQTYGQGDRNPSNSCQLCDSSKPSQWSVAAQNTSCKNNLNADGVCAGGTDTTCVANNQCYFPRVGKGGVLETDKSLLAAGALDGTCGVCKPDTNRWAASPADSGKAVNVGADLTFCDGTGTTAAATKGVCEMTNNGANVNALDSAWRTRSENFVGEWKSVGAIVYDNQYVMAPSGEDGLVYATYNDIWRVVPNGSPTRVSASGCNGTYAGLGVKSDGTVVWSCSFNAYGSSVVIKSAGPGGSSSMTVSGLPNTYGVWYVGMGANDQLYVAGPYSNNFYSVGANGNASLISGIPTYNSYSSQVVVWSNGSNVKLYSTDTWSQYLSEYSGNWQNTYGQVFVATDGTVYRKDSSGYLFVKKPGQSWVGLGRTGQAYGPFVVTSGGVLWETSSGSYPRPSRVANVVTGIAQACSGAGATGCVVRTTSSGVDKLESFAKDAFKSPLRQTPLYSGGSQTGYREFKCDPGSAAGKYALAKVDFVCPGGTSATAPNWKAGAADVTSSTQFCHAGVLKACPAGEFVASAGLCSCAENLFHNLSSNVCTAVTQTCSSPTGPVGLYGRDNGGLGCSECRSKQAANGVWLNEVEWKFASQGTICAPSTANAKYGGGVCSGTSATCSCPTGEGYVTNLNDGFCLKPDAVANPSSSYENGAAPGYDRYLNWGGSFPGYVSQDANLRAKAGWMNNTQNAIACGNYFWSLSSHVCKSRYCVAGKRFNRSTSECETCPVGQTSDAGFEPSCHWDGAGGSSSGCDGWYALADAYQTYDSVANLYWEDPMSVSGGPVTFEAAKKYCADLNKQPGIKATGAQKWRLPTSAEVSSWSYHYYQKVCRDDGSFGMLAYRGTPTWYTEASNPNQGYAVAIQAGWPSFSGAQASTAVNYFRCVHQ